MEKKIKTKRINQDPPRKTKQKVGTMIQLSLCNQCLLPLKLRV